MSWRLQAFSELPSTSDYCIGRAKAGEAAGLAVLAGQQSAGRGSRGRQWLSPPGNVALSVLLRPDITPAQSSMFPLLAGIAVAKALQPLLSTATPMLKWPNDVLLGNAKCAGLLIDAAHAHSKVDWLVIGIGINVAYAPDLPGRVTTCLAAHGAAAGARAVADAVLGQLASWVDRFETFGPTEIIKTWIGHAHPIGTRLEVRGGEQTEIGTFAGLSPAGELLLRVEDRIEIFRTGEILLGTGE